MRMEQQFVAQVYSYHLQVWPVSDNKIIYKTESKFDIKVSVFDTMIVSEGKDKRKFETKDRLGFYLIMSNASRTGKFCLLQHLQPKFCNNECPTS